MILRSQCVVQASFSIPGYVAPREYAPARSRSAACSLGVSERPLHISISFFFVNLFCLSILVLWLVPRCSSFYMIPRPDRLVLFWDFVDAALNLPSSLRFCQCFRCCCCCRCCWSAGFRDSCVAGLSPTVSLMLRRTPSAGILAPISVRRRSPGSKWRVALEASSGAGCPL